MSNPAALSNFNFGEYDARREFIRAESYFLNSFIAPGSFSIDTLNNRNNYIIIGQKGAGKTSCQLFLETEKMRQSGYLCSLLSFFDDLTQEDYKDFSTTQRMSFTTDIEKLSNIELLYDFKEVWKRIFLIRIAKLLKDNGFSNLFVDFCLSSTTGSSSIIDGIKRSLKIELKLSLSVLETKISMDPSMLQKTEVTISEFNSIAEKLLVKECVAYRIYFFVDELVISTFNTKSDEYKARTALIRDIIRVCCHFNDFSVKNDLDMHFICSLRPEVRTLVNNIDPEISKIMDGNDVFLRWNDDELFDILTYKIVEGAPTGVKVDAEQLFPDDIQFGTSTQDYMQFLLNQTWHKPRDIVRFMKSYAKINPTHTRITVDGTKQCLNEYARVSAVEIFEQISVLYPPEVITGIRKAIKKRYYADANDLAETLRPHIRNFDPIPLLEQLYQVGIIGNIDRTGNNPRYFWSHREEEELDQEMEITIHNGLLNYFNVRHR